MDMIFNLITAGIVVFFGYRIFALQKRNKKNKAYINCINHINDETQIFELVDKLLIDMKDDQEFICKGKIIKLYAATLYQRSEFYNLIDEIDFKVLITNKDKVDINIAKMNEDSYFYYCFFTHLFAFKNKDYELIAKLEALIKKEDEFFSKFLFYKIYLETLNIYKSNDEISKVLVDLFEGYYDGIYSKEMISYYKGIGSCFLIYNLKEKTNVSYYEELKNEVTSFIQTNIGKKVATCLDLTDKYSIAEENTTINAEETESTTISEEETKVEE